MRDVLSEQNRKYVLMALISVVPLALVAVLEGEQWAYLAGSLLLLNARRKGLLSLLCFAGVLAGYWWCVQSAKWIPTTIDMELWRLDLRLGYDPWTMIDLLNANQWLRFIAKTVYFGFPLGLTLAALASGKPESFFKKVAVATLLGTLLCMTFPACGPAYVITGKLGIAPRNAMPSMHTAWALLVFWNLRGKSFFIRLFADLFLVFTVIATLGSGEHYLIDLIAALPFFAMVEFCSGQYAPAEIRDSVSHKEPVPV